MEDIEELAINLLDKGAIQIGWMWLHAKVQHTYSVIFLELNPPAA
jgi:hypothetical protein